MMVGRRETLWGLALVVFLLGGGDHGTAAQGQTTDHGQLSVSVIREPTTKGLEAERKINDLFIYRDRLYLGHGDANVNTGPTDVIYYDLRTKRFVTEFTVDDEAITCYRRVDRRLVIPGIDATEGHELGNIYVLGTNGWLKRRSLPLSVHVFDVVSFDGRWYASVTASVPFGEGASMLCGAVLASADQGASWQLEYATASSSDRSCQISSLVVQGRKLFVFPFAYALEPASQIPKEYLAELGNPRQVEGEERYVVIKPYMPGPMDALSFEGGRWSVVDLVPEPDVCFIRPYVFRGNLVLDVVSGKCVAAQYHYIRTPAAKPGHRTRKLFVHDGDCARELDVTFKGVRDVLIKKQKLLLLLAREGGKVLIGETADLEHWNYYDLPATSAEPICLEYKHGAFFIGLQDGSLLRAEVAR